MCTKPCVQVYTLYIIYTQHKINKMQFKNISERFAFMYTWALYLCLVPAHSRRRCQITHKMKIVLFLKKKNHKISVHTAFIRLTTYSEIIKITELQNENQIKT